MSQDNETFAAKRRTWQTCRAMNWLVSHSISHRHPSCQWRDGEAIRLSPGTLRFQRGSDGLQSPVMSRTTVPLRCPSHRCALVDAPDCSSRSERSDVVFEIEVFSDPVRALVGNTGLLGNAELDHAASYDAELIKPGLLLADRVVLRSLRVDLISDEYRDGRMIDWDMPLLGIVKYLSESQDPEALDILGLTKRDLIDRNDIETYQASFGEDSEDDRRLWAEFRDKAEPIQIAIAKYHNQRRMALISQDLRGLVQAGLLQEEPWDPTPKSQVQKVIDSETGDNAAYERAFDAVTSDLASSTRSVMIDDAVRSIVQDSSAKRLSRSSDATVRGAMELLRMVDGISTLGIDEIKDIRADLEPYLAPFRSYLLEVSSGVKYEPDDPVERQRQLVLAWQTQVAPAVRDMESHVRSASFIRNARDVLADKNEVLWTLGMSIGIGLASGVVGISVWSAAAAAASPGVKALAQSVRAKQEVKQNKAYFVHALNKRLRGR